jgi:CheY-like chemotaxis protein
MAKTQAVPEPSIKPSVLVVEDNETNVRLARLILEKGGYRVVVAPNGMEGVAAAKRERFDVIFMDLQMPSQNGWAATREIRQFEGWARSVPIIALTASVLTEETKHCFEVGMDDFVAKPFKIAELIEKCQYWMNRRPVSNQYIVSSG